MAVLSHTLSLSPPSCDIRTGNELVMVQSVLSMVRLWRDEQNNLFLFDSSLFDDPSLVTFNMELARFMEQSVAVRSTSLTSQDWDLVLCASVAWLQSVYDMQNKLPTNGLVTCFGHVVFSLLHRLATCIQLDAPSRPDCFPPNIANEWKDVFSPAITSFVLMMFMVLAEADDDTKQRVLVPGINYAC